MKIKGTLGIALIVLGLMMLVGGYMYRGSALDWDYLDGGAGPEDEIAMQDTTPPIIEWTSPQVGDKFYKQITLSARVADHESLVRAVAFHYKDVIWKTIYLTRTNNNGVDVWKKDTPLTLLPGKYQFRFEAINTPYLSSFYGNETDDSCFEIIKESLSGVWEINDRTFRQDKQPFYGTVFESTSLVFTFTVTNGTALGCIVEWNGTYADRTVHCGRSFMQSSNKIVWTVSQTCSVGYYSFQLIALDNEGNKATVCVVDAKVGVFPKDEERVAATNGSYGMMIFGASMLLVGCILAVTDRKQFMK